MNDLSVVIPTLNEEKSIGVLLKEITNIDKRIEIIVCDDGSTDKTKEMVSFADGNIIFVDRKNYKNKGLTASVITGIEMAKSENIIVMDGDMQHPPGIIKEIYEKLKEGSEIVVASRKKRNVGLENKKRVTISDMGTNLAFVSLKKKNIFVKDPLTGFFGLKKNSF